MLDRIDWRELTTARICELTGVDDSTARRYKRQRRAPPPVERLLRLHLDGRVVPPSWPLSRFEGDRLRIDNEYYTEGELRAWFWNRQMIHDQLSELRARVNRTLRPLDTPEPRGKVGIR